MKLSSSPWGAVQHQNTIAPGMISVSTSGHGGIWLDDDRWQRLLALFPGFKPYSGAAQWLEEDCEWALAALAFPTEFTPQDVHAAVETAIHWLQWATIPADAKAIRDTFHATIADRWEIGSMGWGQSGSWFNARHVTTGESRYYRGDAPSGRFIAESDLSTFQRVAA